MRARIMLWIRRLWRTPGFRISAFAAAALLIAFIAPFVHQTIPDSLIERFSRDAVLPILTILASSMLAVTTFSLGAMTSAFRSAASQATPRVYNILMQDMTTLNVMSVFVGAFLFSLSAIVMFRAGFYGESGAVIVFALTVVCIVMIVIAILRWIAHLSRLGGLDHTLGMVEEAAVPPLTRLAEQRHFGARPADEAPRVPTGATPLISPVTGFVQFISISEMHSRLESEDARLWVTAAPGAWVLKGEPVAFVTGMTEVDDLMDNFTLGERRTTEQDGRFGIIVLSEVASRALSPGINDPGTAIDVIHRVERVLWNMGAQMSDPGRDRDVKFPRIIIGTVSAEDLLQDGLSSLMHDGGGRYDVMSQVLKTTTRLARSDWAELAEAAAKAKQSALDIIDRRVTDEDARASLRRKADEA
ncbi:DUF2254 domain-containing protein [Marivita sp. GX14005]|uniref:DUF2254 domain-containing protein n=1 Tax=Marivita sp. GX14005 TaxID=2942276 RepID=UPI00201927CA|nr:DUF2254 domain-containing protein [Marivita sp. GX14005]MCL3881144.1 DUF2254 domain-containing protein [Marivita sp. GX14005]